MEEEKLQDDDGIIYGISDPGKMEFFMMILGNQLYNEEIAISLVRMITHLFQSEKTFQNDETLIDLLAFNNGRNLNQFEKIPDMPF